MATESELRVEAVIISAQPMAMYRFPMFFSASPSVGQTIEFSKPLPNKISHYVIRDVGYKVTAGNARAYCYVTATPATVSVVAEFDRDSLPLTTLEDLENSSES